MQTESYVFPVTVLRDVVRPQRWNAQTGRFIIPASFFE